MRVLIADDEAVSRKLLENTLRRWEYVVVTAKDGLEALRILQEPDAPKLAILDWLMPGLDGVQICRRIRSQRTEPYTYILLLTGKNAKCDVIEGLDAGADDYVIKPFDSQELQVRLRTGKRILYLQDQLIAAREALRDQATHDSLTGLWNRAATLELLANELARQQRHGGSIGVVLVDLDGFKQINDKYGHLVGDQILHAASQAMQSDQLAGTIPSVVSAGKNSFSFCLGAILLMPAATRSGCAARSSRFQSTRRKVGLA